mgnify:FL=1
MSFRLADIEKILSELQVNSDQSLNGMAKKVSLSKSQVRNRIKKIWNSRRYHIYY